MSKVHEKTQEELDQEQERLLAEECILVDRNDRVVGHASKKTCHLNENIRKGLLHRAFSVFLFNSEGKLLLQQRSSAKITFPDRWTNTCCSHPLYIDDEREEKNNIGVKRAAVRKLQHELGIDLKPEDFTYITRIYYKAESNGNWGEHEVDHLLFVQKDIPTKLNENEVQAVKYVSISELKQMFDNRQQQGTQITPWFHMIANKLLFPWWEKLDKVMAGKLKIDHEKIHHLTLDEEDEE